MRQRRAERCLLRADVALEAGLLEEARQALAEARELDPSLPGLDSLEWKIASAAAEAVAANPRRRGRAVLTIVAASLALAVAGALGWRGLTHRAHTAAPGSFAAASAGAAIPAPAETLAAQTAAAAPEPAAETAAVTTPVPTNGIVEPPVDLQAPPRSEPESLAALDTGLPQPSADAQPPSAAASPAVAERVAPLPVSEVDNTVPEPVPLASLDVASLGSPIGSTAPDVENAVRTRAVETAALPDQNAQRAAIRETLSRYAAAYSGLDASAARAVWPSVDQRALARAFDGLASQRVLLDQCDVLVNGATARATCSGTAEWTPKVGGGPRTATRRWMFELQNSDAAWQIVRAEAR